LQLWDTAGSEKYRAMTTNHYRNAVGALLVYDVSNEESFNNLDYWLEKLKENLDPYALIGLCANKVDIMFTSPEQREVLKEQGMQFARQN
jgi:GTPase SAR1 family protein